MIKTLIFQTLKICLVLAIGQIPAGKTTVGGALVSHMGKILENYAGRKSVEKVTAFFESLNHNGMASRERKPAQKIKANSEQIRAWVSEETFDEKESGEINRLLEGN